MATHQKHRVENSKNKTDVWMLQEHEMCNFHEYIFSNCTSEFWFCSNFLTGILIMLCNQQNPFSFAFCDDNLYVKI